MPHGKCWNLACELIVQMCFCRTSNPDLIICSLKARIKELVSSNFSPASQKLVGNSRDKILLQLLTTVIFFLSYQGDKKTDKMKCLICMVRRVPKSFDHCLLQLLKEMAPFFAETRIYS